MEYIGMDIHKNYSSVAVTDERGDLVDRCRIDHRHRSDSSDLLSYILHP